MSMTDVIAQIDAEIARLEAAKATLARFMVPVRVAPTAKPRQGQKATGTESIVLDVMREGADTLAAITKDAKVRPNTARVTVLALEAAGRVRREGKGSKTRYRVAA